MPRRLALVLTHTRERPAGLNHTARRPSRPPWPACAPPARGRRNSRARYNSWTGAPPPPAAGGGGGGDASPPEGVHAPPGPVASPPAAARPAAAPESTGAGPADGIGPSHPERSPFFESLLPPPPRPSRPTSPPPPHHPTSARAGAPATGDAGGIHDAAPSPPAPSPPASVAANASASADERADAGAAAVGARLLTQPRARAASPSGGAPPPLCPATPG